MAQCKKILFLCVEFSILLLWNVYKPHPYSWQQATWVRAILQLGTSSERNLMTSQNEIIRQVENGISVLLALAGITCPAV